MPSNDRAAIAPAQEVHDVDDVARPVARQVVLPDHQQLVRIRVGQRLHQHRMHDAEQRRRRADADRERRDRADREERCANEHTKPVLEVRQHRGHGFFPERRNGGAGVVGGAADREAVSGAAIEKLADHLADAFLGVADRMAVVANHDVTAAREVAHHLVGARRRRDRIELAGNQQRRHRRLRRLAMRARHGAARPLLARGALLLQPIVAAERAGRHRIGILRQKRNVFGARDRQEEPRREAIAAEHRASGERGFREAAIVAVEQLAESACGACADPSGV